MCRSEPTRRPGSRRFRGKKRPGFERQRLRMGQADDCRNSPAGGSVPLLRCFRFANYLSEQWLFGSGLQPFDGSKFGLANCHLMGIVSVSRSVQSVNCRPRQDRGNIASSP